MERLTFRERQVREMAEKAREANELITKALRPMIPDPPVRVFLVNAGRALDAGFAHGRSTIVPRPAARVVALLMRALATSLLRSRVLPQCGQFTNHCGWMSDMEPTTPR